MIKSITSRFVIIVVIAAYMTICHASVQADPNWYSYSDNFQSSDNAENGSFYHSIFWPQGAFPPSEPYLYHTDSDSLGFGGFNGQDNAQIVYRFPLDQGDYIKAIIGELKVDVNYPYENSGSKQELRYSLSIDGINWSKEKQIFPGTNIIKLESIRGICYVKFSGIGVTIDNLAVFLNPRKPDRLVPSEYSTIQAAIDDANEGDLIQVSQGTYSGSGNSDIDFKGKSVLLYSEKGSGFTKIECGAGQRGFYFHEGEDTNSVLCGFTIKNGNVAGSSIPDENRDWYQSKSHPVGGGIYCEFSNPSIIDCVVENCSTKIGGGIGLVGASPYIADSIIQKCNSGNLVTDRSGGAGAGIGIIGDSNAVIVNTTIKENTTHYNSNGAGVYCFQSRAVFSNCEFIKNKKNIDTSGTLYGGGVYAGGLLTDLELRNCLIADNKANYGAGVFTDSIENITEPKSNDICNVLVTNCTIANNKVEVIQSTSGGGIHSLSSNIIVKNSIVWDNNSQNIYIQNSFYELPVRYSDIQGGYEGQYNIAIDPCFVSVSTGDYHLKSQYSHYDQGKDKWAADNQHSECIDAGDPQDAVGPEPVSNGKRINMGAYGGTEQASMNISPRILHVSKNGNNGNSGFSKENAFKTIQKAVDVIADYGVEGDVIMIWPGTYEEKIDLWPTMPRRMTIQSADDAAEIRGSSEGIAFSFHGGQYSGFVLRNLIITNCTYVAIYCENASPTLTNLTIANNGYGIFFDWSSGSNPSIKRCIFANNGDGDGYDDVANTKNVFVSRLDKVMSSDHEQGNINDNPRFVSNDSENGDYHLQSYYGRYSPSLGTWVSQDQYHSPCIDIYYPQDPSLTYPEREPQPNGSRMNMGAYGGTPYASKSLE